VSALSPARSEGSGLPVKMDAADGSHAQRKMTDIREAQK
jgi:hypothetical protein